MRQACAGLDDAPSCAHAGAMPRDARQVAALRPAAVAVHDDGDVLGQALAVDLLQQSSFFLAGRFQLLRGLHDSFPMNSDLAMD